MPEPVTSPGIDAARLKWLLDCEAAIKSMAAQFLCPKVSPQQLVKDILDDSKEKKCTSSSEH